MSSNLPKGDTMVATPASRISAGGAHFCGGDTQYANAVRQHDRTGRHGACAACPIDAEGWTLAEDCPYTVRYDHDSRESPERERYRS